MWECPREQSRRRANTKALLPASHPAQRTWKRKLPLLRADAVRFQTQAQVLPGLEILMLYMEVVRQMLIAGRKRKENQFLLAMVSSMRVS